MSFLAKSSGRRIDGSLPSAPASAGFHDSSTVPPVTVKMPKRSGGRADPPAGGEPFEEG